MRLIKLRAISVATSLALLAGAAGFGSLASAATAPTVQRTITVTDTTATIDWTTDVPTEGQVLYGLAKPYTASTSMETSFDTTHHVVLTGLTPNTTYQYEIDVVDQSGNTGTSGQLAVTTNASTSTGLPVISNIAVTPTSSGATITWNTDAAASSQVFYGTTASYGASTTLDSTLVTSHSVTLSGLTASTTYHYQIQSANSAGTATFADRTFDTLASSSGITINRTISQTDTTATIDWTTNVPTEGNVSFGTTTAFTASTSMETSFGTSHSVTLSGLTPNTTYQYEIDVHDASGNTATFGPVAFTTNASGTGGGTGVVLALNGVDAVNSIALPDNTYQDGFKWVLHLTVPDAQTSFALKFNDFSSASTTTNIPVAGNLRYYSAQSSNASTTASAITESNNDYGGTLSLTGDTSTSTPGRQIDVIVELKVPPGTQAGVYSALFGARSL